MLLVICGIFVIHGMYLNCVAEDAFTISRFYRNLADGIGLRLLAPQPCLRALKMKLDVLSKRPEAGRNFSMANPLSSRYSRISSGR